MLQEESPWIGRQRSMPAPGIACVDSMNNWAPESRSSWNGLRDRHVDVETQRKKENGNSVALEHIFWFLFDSIRSNPSRVLVIQIRRGSIADAIRICLSSNRPISKTTPQTCMESLRLHSQRLSTLNSRLSTKYAFSISCWIGCICSSWKWTNSGPNNCVTRDYT